MNILYAVHGYKPAWRIGGPALSVSAAAETLVRRGHKVTVFTTNSNLTEPLDVPTDQPVDVDGVTVWYFEQRRLLERLPIPYLSASIGFLYTPAMRVKLREMIDSFDLVHTHLPFVYPTQLAGRAAIRTRKPLFYHQRGVFDPERLRFRGLKKNVYIELVEKPIMKRATTLIALTPEEVDSYRALGVKTPVRIVPNGIDAAAYSAPVPSGRWASMSGIVILFLGRLHPTKGADKLLEGFLEVARDHPDATLVMAGPDEWGLESEYGERARAAALGGRVVFPGMVSGEDKRELLSRADLFVLPSQAEGFSMAVLEAMASGTAVLLSPRCHFPKLEERGAGAIVLPDAGEIARSLRTLLASRDVLRAMGAKGREIVRNEYSWDHVVDQLLDVYGEGVARHRAMP